MSTLEAQHGLKIITPAIFAGADPAFKKMSAIRRIFGFIPEAELYRLTQTAEIRSFRQKQPIFHCGDPGVSLIAVMEGFVKLSTVNADGREIVLDVVGPGTCIGELAVMCHWVHDTDATALSHCRVLSIDTRQFRQSIERNPACLWDIVRMVGARLEKTTEQLADALALSARAHLAKAILRLARLRQENAYDTTGPRLRQSELAAMTGLSRENVNRLLGGWSEAGWIRIVDGLIRLVDAGPLCQLIGEDACQME
jgi:CRP/FNR family transcriptional regulator, cyclic AMP receptor protein